ncbi:hypothetical protein FRC11_003767, partial [Ceratobasidium sp. 423]
MASVEPGTYRIINLARNKALRVPNEYPDTIASWHTQDEPNQKVGLVSGQFGNINGIWDNSGLSNVSMGDTDSGTVGMGDIYPFTVHNATPELIMAHPQRGRLFLGPQVVTCTIQLEGADRVLDLHDRGEVRIFERMYKWAIYMPREQVYIWPANDVELQKVWKFERLGLETGEELKEEGEDPTPGPIGNTSLTDQSVPTDEGMANNLPAPLSPLTASDVHVAQQTREIQSLQRQLSKKDQEIEKLREGLALLSSQEPSQVAALLQRTTQLEELVET